jgi:hypothetical protein
MRKKRPRVASPDEVRITRESESALIEFADESIASTHLTIGPRMRAMTDQEILECYSIDRSEHLSACHFGPGVKPLSVVSRDGIRGRSGEVLDD